MSSMGYFTTLLSHFLTLISYELNCIQRESYQKLYLIFEKEKISGTQNG
jgi:hypothetical protein